MNFFRSFLHTFLLIGLMTAFAMFSQVLIPSLAFAQEAGASGLSGFFSGSNLMVYLLIALAVVEVAKRVTAIIPGKRDDEIVGTIDKVLRRVVDFIAGKTGKPSDPSLVKRE